MRILLACDHKWRDLPALVAIKCHLEAYGHRALIASTKEFEALMPYFQPDAVLLNHFWDRRYCRLAQNLRNLGIAVLVLPTEGSGSTDHRGLMIFGGFSDYSLIDLKLCWNSVWADGIVTHGSMPRERLEVVGCPRFDFAVPPLVNTNADRAEMCATLGLDRRRPIVTWASRFALAKLAYASAEQRAAYAAYAEEIGVTQSLKASGHTVDELIATFKVSLDKFIDAVGIAAQARPDVQVVFKPHPNDDIGYIKQRLEAVAPNRVRFAVGRYIGDVLRATDVLVNNSCNTSVEAWVQGIPVIDARLHPDAITAREDISACNSLASSPEAVVALIDQALGDRHVCSRLSAAREAFIAKWYLRIDGQRCEHVAGVLHRFMSDWGHRRKFYPIKAAGGLRHVVRTGVGWLLAVPSGERLTFSRPGKSRVRGGGVLDKVISRADVRALQSRLQPLITPKTALRVKTSRALGDGA